MRSTARVIGNDGLGGCSELLSTTMTRGANHLATALAMSQRTPTTIIASPRPPSRNRVSKSVMSVAAARSAESSRSTRAVSVPAPLVGAGQGGGSR